MAGLGDATENDILNLYFRAVAVATYAATTGTQTNIGISLNLSDPTDSGNASSGEATYTGYTRVNVARSTGGWTAASGGSISPAAAITFPAGTAGSGTASFWTTGASNATPPTGAQVILWYGGVAPPIVTGNGVTPQLTTGSTITLD